MKGTAMLRSRLSVALAAVLLAMTGVGARATQAPTPAQPAAPAPASPASTQPPPAQPLPPPPQRRRPPRRPRRTDPPAGQTPVFRAGIEVLPLDVVVLDRDGRQVTDLTSAEFQVEVDGSRAR